MFYIGGIQKSLSVTEYIVLDTLTGSALAYTKEDLQAYIFNAGIKIANASMKNGQLILSDWYKSLEIHSTLEKTKRYILTIIEDDTTFYLKDLYCSARKEDINGLLKLINRGYVLNCRVDKTGELIYKDVIYTKKNAFRSIVDTKYKNYVAKALLLGYDLSFDYTIQRYDVVLDYYKGTSKNIILPEFVTSLGRHSFSHQNIESIKLNEGLKYIGEMAFHTNNIASIQIPKSVEYIMPLAFANNKDLKSKNIELLGNTVIFE